MPIFFRGSKTRRASEQRERGRGPDPKGTAWVWKVGAARHQAPPGARGILQGPEDRRKKFRSKYGACYY
jgi:hypothetical protein